MNDFTDLVRKITAIDLDEDTSTGNANPYKPVEEAVSGTRDTANILKAFSAIEGNTGQLDEISSVALKRYADEVEKSMPRQDDGRYKPITDPKLIQRWRLRNDALDKAAKKRGIGTQARESDNFTEDNVDEVSDKKLDAYRQKAFQDQPAGDDGSDKYRKRKTGRDLAFDKQTGRAKVRATTEDNVVESKTTEDVVGDLRTRFADFLKAEVQQGNDLNTISSAVQEGTASARAIDRSFDSMFSIMGRLVKMTQSGGALYKQVEQEGGDPSWIEDANEKLSAAYSALEEAHMYALPMSTEDD